MPTTEQKAASTMRSEAPTFSRAIGIAVTTHNRSEQLGRLLKSLRSNTKAKIPIAVFDDGNTVHPTDENQKLCDFYIQAPSSGLAENKNRGLYFFSEINPVRRIVLIEDDLLITAPNWLKKWRRAIDQFGHINLTFPSWNQNEASFIGGKGTPRKPHRWTKVTGQVTGADMTVMKERIGYMNPMFAGFGHEHLEWTERWISEGFGDKKTKEKRIYFALEAQGIELQDCPSTGQDHDTSRNRDIHVRLRKRGHPKIFNPWLNDTEQGRFLAAFKNK